MTCPQRSRTLGLVALLGVAAVFGVSAAQGVSSAAASAASSSKGLTKSETVTRTKVVDGKVKVVDKRSVSLHLTSTTNLRGRQEIGVSWSGAHPTGGIVADQNSADAAQEEYPFVLLECRGLDSTTVNKADRLSPETCWTQDWTERYQDTYNTDYPPYRLDEYATAADRKQVAGAPSTVPAACKYLLAPTQHWVPFISAAGHVYDGGTSGCGGMAPESNTAGGSALPSNETFGVTDSTGHGSADFDVWTSAENASLGCSQTVACSLVAVPVMGISCDPTAAATTDDVSACEATGSFKPGELATSPPEGDEDLSVSGLLWWSASNWRNRISVPLNFAPPSDACDVVSSSNAVDVYGSELAIQATAQWAPHFCLNPKLFKITHVQTGEPEARNLVATGGAEAAFVSDPPSDGYGKPVVNAPIGVTGFAIGYSIDGASGQPYTKLRLDPRLLAKLLTESYPSELPIQEEDSALSNNPLNITLDPEFQKLNPGITHGVAWSEAASELVALSSDSDVIEALTTYINDNPSARKWLNGDPDQWGMTVNPAYQGIKLPVNRWPLLSKFEPKAWYASNHNDCLHNSPVPYLPLVAAPMARLEEISESLQFSIANSTTTCSQTTGTTAGEKLIAAGRQPVGYRFMIGITSAADAKRYQIRTAALQTTSSHQFVKPSRASMRAAVSLVKPDESTGVWPIPYEKLRTSEVAAKAYPGTAIIYAAIPTSGLPSADAHDYAAFLRYVITKGQRSGSAVGRLAPGFLPLTKANGLGSLAGYTWAAAGAVAAQKGALPDLTGNPAPGRGGTGPSTKRSDSPGTNPGTTSSGSNPASDRSPSEPQGSPSSTGPEPSATAVAAVGRTVGIGLGGGGLALVVVIALTALAGLAAPAVYVAGRKRGRW